MNTSLTRLKAGGTHAKTEQKAGFMSVSVLPCQGDEALKRCPTPPGKASSLVWRALQLQGNMHYKAGALE